MRQYCQSTGTRAHSTQRPQKASLMSARKTVVVLERVDECSDLRYHSLTSRFWAR